MATNMELTTDGELKIKGNLNTRLPAVTDGLVAHFPFDGTLLDVNTKQCQVYAKAYPSDGPYPSAGVYINGTLAYAYSRDWHISVWNPATGDWATGINFYGASAVSGGHARYDVYADTVNQRAAFSNTIANLSNNYLVIIGASHAPENFDANMATQIKRCGGTSAKLGWAGTRGSYICVGVVGCGEGKALVEELNNLPAASNPSGTYSWAVANFELAKMPIVADTVAMTKEGIIVEEATTNFQSGISPWTIGGGLIEVVDSINSPIKEAITWKFTKTGSASQWHGWESPYGGIFDGSSGESWTISGWYKTLNDAGINFLSTGFYLSDWSRTVNYTTLSRNTSIISDGEWHFFWHSMQLNETMTDAIIADGPSWTYSNSPGELYINGLQWEKKAYPTYFTNNSRGGSLLKLPPSLLNINNGAISFEFNYQGLKYSSTNQWMMLTECYAGASYETNKINIVIQGDRIYTRLYNNSNGGWGSAGLSVNSLINGWNKYTISWNKATMKFRECINDTYSEQSPTYMPEVSPEHFWIGTWGDAGLYANTEMRNFSIYNKFLSQEEILKLRLNKNQPVFSSSGSISLNKLSSKLVLPSDVYYFPLGKDGKDVHKIINPSAHTNVVYENGGAWVGNGITNILDSNMTAHYSPWGGFVGENGYFTSPAGTQGVYIKCTTGGGALWYTTGSRRNASPSTAYIVTGFIKYVGTPHANTFYLRQYRADGSQITEGGIYNQSNQIDLGNGWKKTWSPFITASDCVQFLIEGYEYTAGVQTYLYNVMCVPGAVSYPALHPLNSRGTSDLEYNLNSSIGLNWGGEWTISYFKKPMGTHLSGLFTGYSIESLGCNGNSVGGGYRWWGKENGSNIIADATNNAIDPATYFGNWHWIWMRKVGTILTINTYLPGGAIATRIIDLGSIPSNYFVTQYGYDFKMGGWDNNAACDAYFRDLVVAKRALTDAELTELFKTKMQMTTSGELQVQNSISTGATIL